MGRRIGALHRTIDRAVNKPKGTKELIDKLQRVISAAHAGKLRNDSSSQAAGAVPARSANLVTEQGDKAGAEGKGKGKGNSAKLGKDSSPRNFRPATLVPVHWHVFLLPRRTLRLFFSRFKQISNTYVECSMRYRKAWKLCKFRQEPRSLLSYHATLTVHHLFVHLRLTQEIL